MLNLDEIRKNIILKPGVHYFDYTASGLAYEPIEREIAETLKTYANTHSDSSSSAIITQRRYEGARESLKKLLGLDERFYLIACGQGATASIKKFQELLGIYLPPATRSAIGEANLRAAQLPLVLVSPYEHHSNELSFREGLCDYMRVPLSESGEIDLLALERILKLNTGRRIIGSFSAASNVTGVVSDYKKISELIRAAGGIVAFDCAALSSHANLDCDHFDAIFLSPHKLLGGVASCGLLAIKKELLNSDVPTFAAGGTVAYANREGHVFLKNPEQLEEGGTPPIIGLMRANLAYALRNEVGFERIKSTEDELARLFESELAGIDEIINYAPKDAPRLPIISFNVRGVSAYDFAASLSNDFGIQTRAGVMCAGPYAHDLLGIKEGRMPESKPGFVRVSLHYTHTEQDVLYLVGAIKSCIKKHRELWGEEKAMYEMFGGKI
ncbi:aminotransferase class V-fold PLP-dependent enzyme [Campylobacter sp. Marseille-Q3452]|uniref:Aminotransferase class V-fold PLP-dependent enzyme n=1 Tax=Campylobacter massiliensis TaxID=2762557 RepID=A0A842J858_9BACT|nr:aminotransferase class V-fold PLP-dependent enzyme [Campylobacter massiliensis]MBC2882229.1 aminotransferase class V-fold PLP-dependent enzyme [Campylobacter massiliensis]